MIKGRFTEKKNPQISEYHEIEPKYLNTIHLDFHTGSPTYSDKISLKLHSRDFVANNSHNS